MLFVGTEDSPGWWSAESRGKCWGRAMRGEDDEESRAQIDPRGLIGQMRCLNCT